MEPKVMKVAFNIRCLSTDKIRGISRYTTEILKNIHDKVELHLISDRPVNTKYLKDLRYKEIVISTGHKHFYWEQVLVPIYCFKKNIDILHNPANYGTPIFLRSKSIVTIHDMISFKMEQMSLSLKLYFFITRIFTNHFITVSEFSKSDIMDIFKVSSDRVSVTYEASNLLSGNTDAITKVEKLDLKEKYFFYIGGWEYRKNIKFFLDSYSKLNKSKRIKLVLAGEKNNDVFDNIEKYVSELKLDNDVILLSWISDKQLCELYKNAYCFVYPSLYEGFGLQVCEAMQFHIPVITSNSSSLPEVLDNPDATFSPNDADELKELLEKVLEDNDFYSQLVEHSVKRAKDFSWKKTGLKTLDVYKKLIK